MKKVYVAHPFGGLEDNKQSVEKYINNFVKKDEDILYVSPIHATGHLYHMMSYEKGMEHCFELLKMCDELWLCGDWRSSRGCNMEYNFALENEIGIRFINLDLK